MLTMMDYPTRYPEAFPLKDIHAETVTEALFFANRFKQAVITTERPI